MGEGNHMSGRRAQGVQINNRHNELTIIGLMSLVYTSDNLEKFQIFFFLEAFCDITPRQVE
jgi:hypothetical protein